VTEHTAEVDRLRAAFLKANEACSVREEEIERLRFELGQALAERAGVWGAGWQAGHDDYDQGTETPNPYRILPPGSGDQS
jgi:hypothetical protein